MNRSEPPATRPRRRPRRGLALLAASLCLAAPLQAQVVLKSDLAIATFDPSLAGFTYTSLPELADAMVDNTEITILTSSAEFVFLVAGVVDAETGDILYGALSEPILANRGFLGLVELASGPMEGAWDAFEDPLFGFEDPLFGFEDPLFGFDNPIVGFDNPIVGFDNPIVGFSDPSFGFENIGEAIDAIWGTGGAAFEPDTSPYFIWGTNGVAAESPEEVLEAIWGTNGTAYEPGTKLLIVTTVSLDPESITPHSAAILPYQSF